MAIQFLAANIVAALIATCIILIKKLFAKHLSPSIQYYLWFPVLLTFWIPFLPLYNISNRLKQIFSFLSDKSAVIAPLSKKNVSINSGAVNIINDFSISVERNVSPLISTIFLVVWIIGAFFAAVSILYMSFKIIKLYRTSMPVQNKQINEVFLNCKNLAKVKTKVHFRSSAFLKSPVTFGIVRPCIIIPIRLISEHNTDELRYILLHELHHCKCKDSIVNCITCLTGIIYWFNPVVWYIKKEICTDREIACDTAVLNRLNPEEYISYGNTLVSFAEKISVSSYAASSIGGTRKQITKRILNIASYQSQTPLKKIKNTVVFLLTCAIVTGSIPYLSVNASSDRNDISKFKEDNIIYKDYETFFEDDYSGSFVLYDLKNDLWQIYNRKNSIKRIAPNSTYKIYSALCALEEGTITPTDNTLVWDGSQYPIDAWNQNQSLKTAMQNSVNWYFNFLDKKNGYNSMQQFFHKIHYGNEDISSGLDRYWLEASLKISPVEQVELLKQFYTNEFGFNQESIQAVKSSLLISSSDGISLYGKTGTGNIGGKNTNGWFIGFIETRDNTFFFATNIQAMDNATGKNAADITFSILDKCGIYPAALEPK